MTLQANALGNVFLFLIVWTAAWSAIAFPLFKKFKWRPFQKTDPVRKLILLLPLYGIAPFIVWGANSRLQITWQTIGVEVSATSLRALLFGLGLSVLGLSLTLWLKQKSQFISLPVEEDEASNSNLSTWQKGSAVLGFLLLGLWIGGIEELVFRGWLQTQLETALTPWIAASVGSFLFAIAHLVWDDLSGLWQQPGLFILGWVLVMTRWANGGNLAMAWGLHAGWVFSLAVLGEFIRPQPDLQKATWLTGRANQPLTDIWDVSLMAITAAVVWQFFGPVH